MTEEQGRLMYVNDEGGMVLTNEERKLVAQRLVVRFLAAASDNGTLIEWEDIPLLGEGSFEMLCYEAHEHVDWLRRLVDSGDRTAGIDSLALIEQLDEE